MAQHMNISDLAKMASQKEGDCCDKQATDYSKTAKFTDMGSRRYAGVERSL